MAELLPGWASAWLMLPSMKNKVKFNCLQHLITMLVNNIEVRLSYRVSFAKVSHGQKSEYFMLCDM